VNRPRARRGEGEHLRDEILEAGRRLLVETGDEDAVTIRAVAREVGVTPPAIYLHFEDKNALLLAVCRKTFEALDDQIEAAAAGIADPLEALRARGAAYARFGRENPEHYRILFMTRPFEHDELEPAEMTSGAFEHHLEAVQRACAAGALPPSTDPLLAAIFLWSGVHGITSLLIAKPKFPWPPIDELVDHVLRTLVEGLLSPGAA
jgi:AcrR family transcriptional regulator